MTRDDEPEDGMPDLNDPVPDASPPYAIGYGKPPLLHRFKPGQSGNRKGRPSRDGSLAASVAAQLAAPVWTVSNGRRRRMSKLEALVAQILASALNGNQRDRDRAAAWGVMYGPKPRPSPPEAQLDVESLSEEQLRVLASIPFKSAIK